MGAPSIGMSVAILATVLGVASCGGGGSLVLTVGPATKIRVVELATGSHAAAIAVGDSARLAIWVFDARDSLLVDAEEWQVRDPLVATNKGSTIHASAIGNTFVIARYASAGRALTDSLQLIVAAPR